MELDLISSSAVVLAAHHNPSILHPAFLDSNEIVPASWKLGQEPICTPPFAQVKYANGVSITAEYERLQFTQDLSGQVDWEVFECLVAQYLKTLPHVPYKALGINFQALMRQQNPGKYLIQQFLKSGSWSEERLGLSSVDLVLRFKPSHELNLAMTPGQFTKKQGDDETTLSGVMLQANFNFPLSEQNALNDAITTLKMSKNLLGEFVDATTRILTPAKQDDRKSA